MHEHERLARAAAAIAILVSPYVIDGGFGEATDGQPPTVAASREVHVGPAQLMLASLERPSRNETGRDPEGDSRRDRQDPDQDHDHDHEGEDPATKQIHLVDLQAGAVTASVTLEQAPNELSGAVGHHH